jgi:hypothetical protein
VNSSTPSQRVDPAHNFHNPSHWCKDPAQEHNRALILATVVPGDPERSGATGLTAATASAKPAAGRAPGDSAAGSTEHSPRVNGWRIRGSNRRNATPGFAAQATLLQGTSKRCSVGLLSVDKHRTAHSSVRPMTLSGFAAVRRFKLRQRPSHLYSADHRREAWTALVLGSAVRQSSRGSPGSRNPRADPLIRNRSD